MNTALPDERISGTARWVWPLVGLLLLLRLGSGHGFLPAHLGFHNVILGLLLTLGAVLFHRRAQVQNVARPAFLLMALALGLRSLDVFLEVGFLAAGNPLMAPLWKLTRLALALPVGLAILQWPTEEKTHRRCGRELLDALLFATALFFVVWMLGLGDLFRSSALGPMARDLTLAFFLVYNVLLGLALYRGLRTSNLHRGPLVWIVIGLCIALAGNLIWMRLALEGRYTGGGKLDLMVCLIPAAFIAAALTPFRKGAARSPRLYALLPYLPFLAALPLGVRFLLQGNPSQDPAGLWLGIAAMGLLGLRQTIAMLDLSHFSRGLERQVAERTQALEESQAVILANQRMNFMATLGAGIAHDLNNLVNVVVLTAEKLELERQEGLPADASDLQALQGVSTRASGLLRKLLSLGAQREAHLETFALGVHVSNMKRLLERLVPTLRLELERGPDEQALWIKADPLHVEQILVNLVSNARDAMPEGGTIRIRVLREDDRVLLEVSDTGVGIPEEDLTRIFDPFFTTKEAGRGTGLGLASVKALVEECRGQLSVCSQPGQGTTFSVRFPAH